MAFSDVPQQPHGRCKHQGILMLQMEPFVAVGSDGDVHGIILLLQLCNRQVFAHRYAGMDLDARALDVVRSRSSTSRGSR